MNHPCKSSFVTIDCKSSYDCNLQYAISFSAAVMEYGMLLVNVLWPQQQQQHQQRRRQQRQQLQSVHGLGSTKIT